MAVTLTTLRKEKGFPFAVTAIDKYSRFGLFSFPSRFIGISSVESLELNNTKRKLVPSRPILKVKKSDSEIVLSFSMDYITDMHAQVVCYQIFESDEIASAPSTQNWRHVGDVQAMLLPMAVTIKSSQPWQKRYFAVRAVDVDNQPGILSLPKTWDRLVK